MIMETSSNSVWQEKQLFVGSPLTLAKSLLRVGCELFRKGFEQDAMAIFESAHSILHANSEHLSVAAYKHLEMGSQLLAADDTHVEEDQFNSPDLYLEDECDVGPRVLRTPAHLESASALASVPCESELLEAALTFNKALIFHDNLDFTEAKRLYQAVLLSLQSMLVSCLTSNIPTKLLLELGTRAHNNMGHICYLAGEEDVARAHFEASLMCARQLSDFTKEHRLVYATVLSNWCRVSWMRGDISDNLYNALREVLRIRTSLLRWNHVDVAASHFNIAVAEYARRRNQKAVSHLMQYLQVATDHAQEKVDDLDHIPALIYLLLIQNEENDDSMSQELVRGLRTLQDKRQDQGPDSPEVASVLNFIGTLLFHKEDHNNALLFFQEELRLEENMPESADDISVSVTCNNIGRILQELGKLNEAVHYYHRALKPEYGDIHVVRSYKCNDKSPDSLSVSKSGKKDCHPSSANLYSTVWYNLGLIHDKLGAYSEAISAFEMSLDLRKAMLGKDHPDIACLMYNIGVLQMEQQLLSEATVSFREALRIRRGGATGQLNDKHVVKTLEKLSSLHKAKGNIKGALEALKEVLHIQEISSDFDYFLRMRETGVTLRSMAELHHATGDLSAALRISIQSVHKLRSILARDFALSNATVPPTSSDPLDQVAVIEQLVSSLLLVGSLYHELCEPLRASTVLKEAVETLQHVRTTRSDLFTSLNALHEVTVMLATTHCAAEA